MRTLLTILLLQTAALFGHAFQAGRCVRRIDGGAARVAPSSLVEGRTAAGRRRTTMTTIVATGGETTTESPHSSSTLEMSYGAHHDINNERHDRRYFLQKFAARSILLSSAGATAVVASTGGGGAVAFADEGNNDSSASSAAGAASADNSNNNSPLPKITHRVFVDVRISRADGTFYVRDDPPSEGPGSDEPYYGRLVLGLYGDRAPEHVRRFLSYVEVPYQVDAPLPSYSRSKFQTLDAATGLLIGGTIPGLAVTTLAGGNVLEYSGRVLPAKLWLEDRNAPMATAPKLAHDAKGLLTHRNLDLTPSFGITTRKSSTSLDSTHTVFGCILEDNDGFLDKVVDLPVLTDGGRVSRTATNEPVVSAAGGVDVGGSSLASSVFTAQRAVFRDAAKTFGDSRLDKVYDGKLLRRIEVTKVGVL